MIYSGIFKKSGHSYAVNLKHDIVSWMH